LQEAYPHEVVVARADRGAHRAAACTKRRTPCNFGSTTAAPQAAKAFEIGPGSTDTAGVESRAAMILGEVLERLRATADRADLLRTLTEIVHHDLACDAVALWVQSARHRPYALRAAVPASVARDVTSQADAEPLTEDALKGCAGLTRGRSTVLEPTSDAAAAIAVRAALTACDGHLLLLPFVRAGRIEALATCSFATPPSAQSIAAWEHVAPHVASVLAASRLDDQHATTLAQRNHFASLGTEVLKATDVETTAVRLCELTRALFGTTRSALFLLEGEDLVPIAAAGPYGDRAAGGPLHVPPGVEPVFDEARRIVQVIVVNHFRKSRFVASPIPLPFRPQAALVIPLTDNTGTIGLLTASELDDPMPFPPDTAEQGRLLGAVATVAMRRMLLLDELQSAGRAKDDFLAAVSHELRTPIDVVLGYVQLLSEQAFGPMTTEQADTMQRIEKGARSQLVLVNDLLDLARIERGALDCQFAAVRLAALVGELRDVARTLIGSRPIVFSVDVPPGVLAWTDPERLKQVLINLLTNAAKFTQSGSIALRAASDGATVTIDVADTGIGMEPGFVRHATEPFVHGEGGGAGSGLGLAIVSRVLRVLGGSLHIDSRAGAGTTVRVLLPSPAAAAERQAAS
jgi:signal transduction histidine kinase